MQYSLNPEAVHVSLKPGASGMQNKYAWGSQLHAQTLSGRVQYRDLRMLLNGLLVICCASVFGNILESFVMLCSNKLAPRTCFVKT